VPVSIVDTSEMELEHSTCCGKPGQEWCRSRLIIF
jgi:hypothetical protein